MIRGQVFLLTIAVEDAVSYLVSIVVERHCGTLERRIGRDTMLSIRRDLHYQIREQVLSNPTLLSIAEKFRGDDPPRETLVFFATVLGVL